MNENREKLKKQHPDLVMTEFSKKCGELWKEMTDKAKWEQMAAEAKKKYDKEMIEYKKNAPSESTSQKSPQKSSKKKVLRKVLRKAHKRVKRKRIKKLNHQ